MLRVIIELDRYGLGREFERLGTLEIANVGGTRERGNYAVRARGKRGTLLPKRVGTVLDHPRLTDPVFVLARKALQAAGY